MARKILLADDSIAVQRAVEATLEPKDFEVLSVSKGLDVIREAKKLHPDVILVDGDLADLNGYEVCRRVKQDPELMGIPVILMVSEEDPERARAVGAEGELAKPFKGEELLQQVMAVVDLSVEPTLKLDTSEIEDFDLGEDAAEEELDLGELDLDEGVLELTDEMGSLGALDDTGEALLEGLDELETAVSEEPSARRKSVKTEELEEISFEEEIDELDLGELELEGTEDLLALEEDLAETPGKQLMVTDEVELGVDLDQELSLVGEGEGELLESEVEGADLLLDTDQIETELASEGLIDTRELEGLDFEEGEPEETMLGSTPGDLGETSIEFEETTVLGAEESTGLAEDGIAETEVALEEGISGQLDQAFFEGEEEEILVEEKEEVFQAIPPKRPAEASSIPFVSPTEGVGVGLVGGLEEVSLEEELAGERSTGGMEGVVTLVELEEVPVEEIPVLGETEFLEISEEDLGIISPFSEEGLRREIVRNLELVAERILSELAPPIVERVARDIALEKAERIIMEEIERIKSGQ